MLHRYIKTLAFAVLCITGNQSSAMAPAPATSAAAQQITCPVCIGEYNQTDFYRLPCGHTTCKECLTYIITSARDTRRLDTLRCPHQISSATALCKQKITPEDMRAITHNEPLIASIAAIHAEQTKELTEHPNLSAWRNLPVGQHNTDAKPCPRCDVQILKDGGCNHMTCSSCTHQFCWHCLGVWNGPQHHGNNYFAPYCPHEIDPRAGAAAMSLNDQLIEAAHNGDDAQIITLLTQGANVNQPNRTGDTALLIAAENGRTNTVRLLINSDANINHQNNNDLTALMLASSYGNTDTARLLIEQGTNVNQPNNRGETALMIAAENDHTDTARLLIDRGANINLQNYFGNTALIIAARNHRTDTARLLIERGAEINHQNAFGDTALMYAASRGHTDTAELLIDRGADANLQNTFGDTALMIASAKDHTNTARLLIDLDANINLQNNNGYTALMFAASANGHTNTARLLIERGAIQNRALLWINNHRLATATVTTAAIATGYALWKYFRK